MNDWGLPQVFSILRELVGEAGRVFLVGGAVRDVFLNRPDHDLDFAVTGAAIPLAQKLANRLGVAYYIMDVDNDVARVLGKTSQGTSYTLDFTGLRGADLQSDLIARDYTVNAMAVDIFNPQQVIDPLKGAQDIKDKILRVCSPTSLTDDPIRIVRGIRQSLSLGFRIDPPTYSLMKSAVSRLSQASPERQRDELFRILSGKRVATGVRLLDQVGALKIILPELAPLKEVTQGPPHVYNAWEHTLALLERLEALLNVLVGEYSHEAADLTLGVAVLRLGRFRTKLEEHFNTRIHSERNLRGLLFLAGLYHDIAKPQTYSIDPDGKTHFYNHDQIGVGIIEKRSRFLALSNPEVDRLKLMVANHMRPHFLSQDNNNLSRRAIYRYFRSTGSAGIDICILALADMLAVYGPSLPQERWQAELETCRGLMESWWEAYNEMIHPPRLLTGDDLIQFFNLQPGRQIGELLDALAEAQAAGEVDNQEAAEAFIQHRLKSQSSGNP